MPAFAVTIPQGALRRSWAALQSGTARAGFTFAGLACQLRPGTRVDPFNVAGTYAALMSIVGQMFSVFEWEFAGWDDEEPQDYEYMLDYGIPVAPIGWEPASDNRVLAFMAAELDYASHGPITSRQAIDIYIGLERTDLSWWAGPVRDSNYEARYAWRIQPPRGRAFAGAWAALPLLCDYMLGNTGNGFLDWTPSQMDDDGDMPRWNMDEILACARAWKEAREAKEKIDRLVEQINADGEAGLRFLDRVLRGEAQALKVVTRPARGKTLADVLR